MDRCLQLHGGYGYINEFEIARLWRDARVQRLYGGTTEIMKEIVGRSLGFLRPAARCGLRRSARQDRITGRKRRCRP